MDKAALVHRRKKRYMAVVLSWFDRELEPLLPPELAEQFKGIVRQKMHALALDACEVIALRPGEEINGVALDLREQVDEGRHAQGRVSA